MSPANNLAADRWYFPPDVPPPGYYWLTVANLKHGGRYVTREYYDAAFGWPADYRLTHLFQIIAFMRDNAPTPYLL